MSRLAWRIFVTIFLTLLATGLGAIAITSWYIEQRATRSATELTVGAETAAEALAAGGRLGLTDWARRQAADRDSLLIFLVVDEWGEELLGRPIPRRASTSEASTSESSSGSPTGEPLLGGSVVTLDLPSSMPILSGADGQRYLLMTVARDGRRGVFGLPATRLSLLALALLLTAVASYWLAGSITRPIIDLKRTAEALSSGKLEARVTRASLQRRDELGELAFTFDRMAGRLSAALQAKEQLLRDVSHELRSPLTRMRLAVALLRKRTDMPPELDRPELDRLELDIARLDELIEDILSISRLQSEPSSLHKESIDLRHLLERIATDAGFEAKEKRCRIEWQMGDTPCILSLDPQWASAAIENVVRNAIRYTREQSVVAITLEQNAHEACLTVRDAGPGVPENQLSQIFEPFYRVERDRGRMSGGTGLGLAIAARVLGAHGGRIEAHNLSAPAAGLMIRMWWPTHHA